jgi:hypothetical protein
MTMGGGGGHIGPVYYLKNSAYLPMKKTTFVTSSNIIAHSSCDVT